MSNNNNVNSAKKVKDDEFYTPYDFVCNELDRYAAQFENKVIYCPCDDPRWSNFIRYFVENFNKLHLQEVFCSYYDQSAQDNGYGTHVCWCVRRRPNGDNVAAISSAPVYNDDNAWSENGSEARNVISLMKKNGWTVPENVAIGYAKKCLLQQAEDNGQLFATEKGSFASKEAAMLADWADIVVTNPPFSKFRDFVDFCINTGKKFLIVGSNIAASYKNVFGYLKDGKLRGGYGCHKNCDFIHGGYTCDRSINFIRPDGQTKCVAVTWYTNMEVTENITSFKSGKKMTDIDPVYYDGHNEVLFVDKCCNYPDDYYGLAAIPVNAFYRFNKTYFDFIETDDAYFGKKKSVNGKRTPSRIIIKRKENENVTVDIEDVVEFKTINNVAPRQTNGRGYVYIFEDEHDRIKIGKTTQPADDRIRALQTGNADEISIVMISCPVFNFDEVEAKMHDLFSAFHIRGEWFDGKCAKNAVKALSEMTAPSKNDVKLFRNI